MKFTRRPDLDAQTRIHIVMLAWLYQGFYGKMTQIAQSYQISRTFLSHLLFIANLQLETLFSDEKLLFQKDHRHLEQLILLLRLEGKCSILSIASIIKALEYHPNSVGSLSQFLQRSGQSLPSPLSMPSQTFVLYLSDEIFALHAPILVTIDARSTAILSIALASDRSAATWSAHFGALEEHHFSSLGMASDRGVGLVAGYHAACDRALWVCDYFHEFRDLFTLLHQWERTAYTAIGKEDEAAQKFARAKSEAKLAKRLQQYAQAHHLCEHAMALYDHLAILLQLLRETLHVCSPDGRLRTVEGVRAELTLLFSMIAELDCAAIVHTLKPIRTHIDDILVPCAQAEAIDTALRAIVPHEAFAFLVLAWHHDHLVYQSSSKHTRYHHREQEFWLACAAGLLGDAFDPLKALVFTKLDTIIRASSLVEMVNSLLRPYLNSCKGQITQEALHLIMFSHNHRRYKSGKRQGKAPIELLTGKPLEAPWWELLLQQVTREEDATDNSALPSGPPLHLVVNSGGHTDRQAMAPCQATVEQAGAAVKDRRPADTKAASSLVLDTQPH